MNARTRTGVTGRGLKSVRAAAVLIAATAMPALAQAPFPFEREMLLDVDAMPGSKRVPILEIYADGRAQIDLWCMSGQGRVEVAGETIRFAIGPLREERCTPERIQRDRELAEALVQVTRWRVETESEVLLLIGPTELRFRMSTH